MLWCSPFFSSICILLILNCLVSEAFGWFPIGRGHRKQQQRLQSRAFGTTGGVNPVLRVLHPLVSGGHSDLQSSSNNSNDGDDISSDDDNDDNNSNEQKSTGRPERGKELGDPFDEEDLYRSYKEIEADYLAKAFRKENESKWKILTESKDDGANIQVSMLKHPSDPTCPYIRMKSIIPVSVEDCWNFLAVSEWDRTMPKMDPFYEGVSIFGEFVHKNVEMILCRKRTKRILAFGKRDLVFLSVKDEPLEDGTWVSGSVSVKTTSIPRQVGYTRAFQDSIAFYQPLHNNTQTALTIICRIDLNDSSEDGSGGYIPMWIYVKTIGRTGALSVANMRNALIQEQKEKLQRLEQQKQQQLQQQ